MYIKTMVQDICVTEVPVQNIASYPAPVFPLRYTESNLLQIEFYSDKGWGYGVNISRSVNFSIFQDHQN